MTNSKNTTIESKVQKIRDEVGENLKMQLINIELSLISKIVRDNSLIEKNLEKIEINKKLVIFETKQFLEREKGSPIYEERSTRIKEAKKAGLETLDNEEERNKKEVKENGEKIIKAKEEIKKIEKGEKKITLNDLNFFTQEKIKRMNTNFR